MDLRSGMKRKREETSHARIRLFAENSTTPGDFVKGEVITQQLNMLDETFFKLQNFLKSPLHSVPFTHEEFGKMFSLIVYLTTSFPYGDYRDKLYHKFFMVVNRSIRHVVLPYLQGKENEVLLLDTVKIWNKYKVMVGWLCQLFEPLAGYCISSNRVYIYTASMNLIDLMVFHPYWEKLRDEVIRLINLEREGVIINKALISESIDLFLEIEKSGSRCYYKDFEKHLFESSAAWYCNSASGWFLGNRFEQYLEKAQRCMRIEMRRLRYCLPEETLTKMLEVIWTQLMT